LYGAVRCQLTFSVTCAAGRGRERISPAKVTVTGQSGRRCAPLDSTKAPPTLAKKWLWIFYPFLKITSRIDKPCSTSMAPLRCIAADADDFLIGFKSLTP